MKTALVLTVIGPDRPGLVEGLAAAVAEHGGNWEQSRMARLGGQFAGILRVRAPEANMNALRAALEELGSQGLRVVGNVIDDVESRPASGGQRSFRLEVVGNDREGIVRDVARALAEQHVNVEEIETTCESAAMSGSPLFRAEAVVGVPESADISKLRKRLEDIGDDLMVEVKLISPDETR